MYMTEKKKLHIRYSNKWVNKADLINQIDKNKLINIAVRTPYDYNVLDVKTYLCSYEASILSFKALSKILTGKEKAMGKLPITLG